MATCEERRAELKAEVLRRLGMDEVPARIQVAWNSIADLVDLHGPGVLDELVGGIRYNLAHPYGEKRDCP